MTPWLILMSALVVAYLLGSFPTGYILGRLLRGIDIREHGSNSTGATNVLRVLGRWPGIIAFTIDFLKGVGAIAVAHVTLSWIATGSDTAAPTPLANSAPWFVCACGLAAIIGHSRSIWLKFSGGKSVATGFGVLISIAWIVGFGAGVVFLASVALSRIVSLGSILASVAAIFLVLATDQPLAYQALIVFGALYVIVLHRANIKRLLRGEEPRIGNTASG